MKIEFKTSKTELNKIISHFIIGNVDAVELKETITVDGYTSNEIIFTVAGKEYLLANMHNIMFHFDSETSRILTKKENFSYELVDVTLDNNEALFNYLKKFI